MAIESDSIQPVPRLRQELLRMMTLAADQLRCLGASVDSVDMGSQKVWAVPSLPQRAATSLCVGHDLPRWPQDRACPCPRSKCP